MNPKKKCICKKCEDCNFYVKWDMESKDSLRKQIDDCLFYVLANEIPLLRSAIDGLQGGVNEARNRSMESKEVSLESKEASLESKEVTLRFAQASSQIMDKMAKDFVAVLQNIEHKMIGN